MFRNSRSFQQFDVTWRDMLCQRLKLRDFTPTDSLCPEFTAQIFQSFLDVFHFGLWIKFTVVEIGRPSSASGR